MRQRSIATVVVDRLAQIIVLLLTLGTATSSTPASAASPEIRTDKSSYDPRERIKVQFANAPGNRGDLVLLVPKDTPDQQTRVRGGRSMFTQRRKKGTNLLGGLAQGEYEARLYDATNGIVVARFPFTVGKPDVQTKSKIKAKEVNQPSVPPSLPANQSPNPPKVATEKNVYDQNEPITLIFENAPGNKKDRITIAKYGMSDSRKVWRQYLRGAKAGRQITKRGLKAGSYEARLYDGKDDNVMDRRIFTVGQNCIKPPSDKQISCALSVRTSKPIYTTDEPIKVFFEGAPGNYNDWISIVQKTPDGEYKAPEGRFRSRAPDGQRKPWTRLKRERTLKGRHVFKALEEGEYELRFNLSVPKGEPVARSSFKVIAKAPEMPLTAQKFPDAGPIKQQLIKNNIKTSANKNESAQSNPPSKFGLPQPGVTGSWLVYLQCSGGRSSRSNMSRTINAFLTITGENDIRADLYVLLRSNDGIALKLSGAYDTSKKAISLKPKEWIYQPRGAAQPVAITAELDPTGLRLNGNTSGIKYCSEFEAIKFSRDIRPSSRNSLSAAWQKYRYEWVNESNCTPFLQWLSEGTSVKSQGKPIPSQVLDSNRFYEVTGKTYDRWTSEDKQMLQAFNGKCIGALRGSKMVSVTSLIRKAQGRSATALYRFLNNALPGMQGSSTQSHFGYLSNYSLVVALRNARLYADLIVREAEGLPDNRDNLRSLVKDISDISRGNGVFTALPASDRKQRASALQSRQERMSTIVFDKLLSQLDMSSYEDNINGLRKAWKDRKPVESDIKTFAANAKQASEFKKRLDTRFVPLSQSVTDQYIKSVPKVTATVPGFIKARKEKYKIGNDVIKYLSAADKKRLTALYEKRNVAAANKLLPGFPDWLDKNISPDKNGKKKLGKLVNEMLGSKLETLNTNSLSPPYRKLATSLSARNKTLKRQICDLPPGFQELRKLVCIASH